MRFPFPRPFALAVLFLTAASAQAVIMKLTPLAEILEGDDYIFVAAVDRLEPDRPGAVFKLEKKLKGTPPYEKLAVNMTGNDESKKANDTKTIFDRLDTSRKLVFFVSKRGKNHNAKVFVEGSWFSVHGTEDPADKSVRWAFQNGEPFLLRTFKGTSAELIQVIEDGLAKKAKPPAPNEKEKPGYGPPVEKKEKPPVSGDPKGSGAIATGGASNAAPSPAVSRGSTATSPPHGGGEVWVGGRTATVRERVFFHPLADAQGSPATDTSPPPASAPCRASSALQPRCEGLGGEVAEPERSEARRVRGSSSSALFGVIPSFVLVGPLAVIAALFPGVFAKMAIGMKRWRAFLVVASINGTLAVAYWLVQTYAPLSGWWAGPKAFTVYLMVVSAVGLCWAGRRYRRMAAEDPTFTNPPTNTELYALAGLTVFVAATAAFVAWYADWRWAANLELPLREFTFIGIAVAVAGLYAAYRRLTTAADNTPAGTPVDRRLSLSGESVGLLTLFLCGFTVVVSGGANGGPVASGTETGDADTIGPKLVGDPKVFDIPRTTQVMSGIAVVGDRLYFGTQFVRSTQEGHLVSMDRNTGEVKWKFGDDDEMLPVFCTPTVVDGKVYCGEGLHLNTGCRMFCVNAADGTPAWEKPIKTASHTEGAPALAAGKLFFPAGDDGLIAVDAKTGAEKWRLKGGKAAGIHIDAAPAAANGRVFVGSGLYSFVAVALDAESGNELWRTDLKLRSFGAPFVAGKFVYFGVGTGNMGEDVFHYPEEGEKKEKDAAGAVICLEAETGKEVWRFDLTRSVHTGLVGDAFSVYAASRDGFVYALDRKTGKLRWKTGIGGAVTAPPAVATSGGMPVAVYAVSREGTAVCLNPQSGAVVWQKPLPGYRYSPTDHNDVLSGPSVVTTPTPTGSRRTIYIGAMTVDPDNPAKKTGAVFRFEDEIGGE